MFYKNFTFCLVTIVFIFSVLVGPVPGFNRNIHAQEEFSEVSLQGNYSAVSIINDNIGGGLFVFKADGNGNFEGEGLINSPIPIKQRIIIETKLAGNYTLNANGRGNTIVTFIGIGDAELVRNFDFIVTQAEINESIGVKIATELKAFRREGAIPSETGVTNSFIQITIKRLPD